MIITQEDYNRLKEELGREPTEAEILAFESQPETKAVAADNLESPAPLPDPFGMAFSDEELQALTDTNSEEAVKLAYGLATPEKRALLGSRVIEKDGE